MQQTPPTETHEGKQRINMIGLIYVLVVAGITLYIAFKDIWPITFFQDLLLDSKNMYPVKGVFVLTLVSVGVVLFPLYWIAKKMVERKNQTEVSNLPFTTGTDAKEFSFSYSVAVNTVIIDSMSVQIKMGFAKRNFLLSKLVNYYLVGRSRYQTLYITYTDDTGKLKNCPLNADARDQQIKALLAELTARFPDRSLSHLSQKEAFKTMKVMNPAFVAMIVLLVIFAVIGVIVFFAVQ